MSGKGPINSASLFMSSPRSTTGSDRSSGGFCSGGPSHLHDWPLGRSAIHERYIRPFPPMYVTEYEANFTWPKTALQPDVPNKMSSWKELEQTIEELADLERKYPAINQDLNAPAMSTKQPVHDHLLAENIEKAYKHYKAKLTQLDHSKQQQKEEGFGESKIDVDAEEEKKDRDGRAVQGLLGGVSGGGKGNSTILPRSKAKEGTGGHGCSRERRIHETIQEKMKKFCASVEALKRGETEVSIVK